MLAADDDLTQVLQENHTASWVATAFYGDQLTVEQVPLTTDGSIEFNGDQQIQSSGRVYLAQDGGESLVPQAKTDPLAPFGQELVIQRVIELGGQSWQIPLGRLRIGEVPDAREYFARYPSMTARVGWVAELELVDRFDLIRADDFLGVESPKAGNTTWQEIQRLSPIPVVQSLPDATLPAGLVYRSRIDAITTLAGNLGGVPHLTREGALTVRKRDAWLTETVPVFTIDGVISLSDGMSNDLYNSVAVTTAKDEQILGLAEITNESDPLAVTRPIGRRTYTHQDPLLTTQAAADKEAATILARVSTRQSRIARVTCLPNPLLELGDYGLVRDTVTGREVFGEVSSMRFSMDPTADMTLELIVAETR